MEVETETDRQRENWRTDRKSKKKEGETSTYKEKMEEKALETEKKLNRWRDGSEDTCV